ncbi:CRISPR-associated protein Cas5 family [Pseudodesulfovibrio mercurii]|uniref:pre-crRNA processing endonuclease n=1 Tax=Pseudodesulfovibrio mercurii TaxID=641491 RepID=F0JK73_9BACT|nr:type I-C CRISPR-associated protein Cas5c [Pseudodesulfovibrio mercurii]EGB16322.1 CRISPR-associated protein Cas5 family [Pseudodesulfovibrio mercurii]
MSGVKLRVWGEYACFTRPEMKVERVSYDVMTPSAARGILEAVYWKPSIRWVVDRIHVMKPIRFDNVRRNEVSAKVPVKGASGVNAAMKGGGEPLRLFIEDNRQQRAALVLRDVEYVIEAHFEYTSAEDRNDGKHLDMFNRRAGKGQCFQRPYLGCREFAAFFEPVEGDVPASPLADEPPRDLGWMLYDLDYRNDMAPLFFRPALEGGVVEVARALEREGVAS